MITPHIQIRALREQAKLTQRQVAAKIFVSQQAYAFYERGRTAPPLYILESLCELYDVDMNMITGYQKKKAPR